MSGILDIYCILLYTCSMAATPSTMLPLGTAAPNFALPNVVTGQTISLETLADKKALLVMFLCRHCKYVQHVKRELATLGRDYQGKDIGIVAISANDAAAYADDAPESLKDMAAAESFTLSPFATTDPSRGQSLYCCVHPDFFLFDRQRKLVYRGQLDDSRPGNQMPVTGKDVRAAIEAVLADQPINPVQKPSIAVILNGKRAMNPRISSASSLSVLFRQKTTDRPFLVSVNNQPDLQLVSSVHPIVPILNGLLGLLVHLNTLQLHQGYGKLLSLDNVAK